MLGVGATLLSGGFQFAAALGAFNINKAVTKQDWGGLKRVQQGVRNVINTGNDFMGGTVNAFAGDVMGAQPPMSHHISASVYNNGRKFGHVLAIFTTPFELEGGATLFIGGVAGAPETFGLSLAASGARVSGTLKIVCGQAKDA